jgi:hypothetical protein
MSSLPISQHVILITLVLDGVSSHHSRRAYRKALQDFLLWCGAAGVRTFNKASVQKYKAELERLGFAPSTISQRLSAIRKLATEAADNALLAPEIAGGITRIKGPRREGVRIGKWLTLLPSQKRLNLFYAQSIRSLQADGQFPACSIPSPASSCMRNRYTAWK